MTTYNGSKCGENIEQKIRWVTRGAQAIFWGMQVFTETCLLLQWVLAGILSTEPKKRSCSIFFSKSTSGIYICMLSCKYKYYTCMPAFYYWCDMISVFFFIFKRFKKKICCQKILKNNTTTHISRYIMLYIRLYTEYNLFMCMHYISI